jgi:hypothetical protein
MRKGIEEDELDKKETTTFMALQSVIITRGVMLYMTTAMKEKGSQDDNTPTNDMPHNNQPRRTRRPSKLCLPPFMLST